MLMLGVLLLAGLDPHLSLLCLDWHLVSMDTVQMLPDGTAILSYSQCVGAMVHWCYCISVSWKWGSCCRPLRNSVTVVWF